MSESPRLVQTGTVNGSPIYADVTSIGADVPVHVTLTADYAMLDPPGYPSRPSFTGNVASAGQFPRTIPNGTGFQVLQCEATALVNAGAATQP
jgi:hypothetical protein